jgi:hypothetical protein
MAGMGSIAHPRHLKGSSNWNGGSGSRLRISCFIGQPLTASTLHCQRSPVRIINAEPLTGVLPEIKLGKITVNVLLIDVLIHTDDATLEDREKPFKSIGVHVAAPPLKLGMVNRAVAGGAGKLEHRCAISDQAAFPVEVFVNQWGDATMIDNQRADFAAALDKTQHLDVGPATSGALSGLERAAYFHVVGLDRLTFTADPAKVAARGHHFADAVHEEPSRLHAAIEGPLNLPGADTFLAGCNELNSLKPKMQREMAVLEYRADPHREGLSAGVAFAQAGAVGLAGQPADGLLVDIAAMGANWAFRPQMSLDIGESGIFVVKMRG